MGSDTAVLFDPFGVLAVFQLPVKGNLRAENTKILQTPQFTFCHGEGNHRVHILRLGVGLRFGVGFGEIGVPVKLCEAAVRGNGVLPVKTVDALSVPGFVAAVCKVQSRAVDVVNAAVIEEDAVHIPHVNPALTAVIDLTAVDHKGVAVAGVDAENAAAVQPAGGNLHGGAVLEAEHAARTCTGFYGVAGCEVQKIDIITVLEAQYVGISRCGGDGVSHCSVHRDVGLYGGINGQIVHIADHQLRPVVAFPPEVVFAARCAIVRCGGEVV